MSIVQLGAGDQHTFALSALRIQLTGTTVAIATLSALDQSGAESVDVRLSPVEVVMTPQPRRVRLVARPAGGGSFPAGTSIGLTLFTEGASSLLEQVLVAPYDVGALPGHELGVLEFAGDRSILVVSGQGRTAPQEAKVDPALVSSTLYDRAREFDPLGSVTPQRPVPVTRRDDRAWLQPGRYALRDASQIGAPSSPRSGAWACVLDGSISMLRLESSGALRQLLELVCGSLVAWTDTWPSSCVLTGATPLEVPDAATSPEAMCRALVAAQPWSSSGVAPALGAVARSVGAGGTVVVVTDGVPGDIDAVAAIIREHSDRTFRFVATGNSVHGLPSDQPGRASWQEDLAGFGELATLPQAAVAAVRTRGDDTLQLDGSRAAELALTLTTLRAVTP